MICVVKNSLFVRFSHHHQNKTACLLVWLKQAKRGEGQRALRAICSATPPKANSHVVIALSAKWVDERYCTYSLFAESEGFWFDSSPHRTRKHQKVAFKFITACHPMWCGHVRVDGVEKSDKKTYWLRAQVFSIHRNYTIIKILIFKDFQRLSNFCNISFIYTEFRNRKKKCLRHPVFPAGHPCKY